MTQFYSTFNYPAQVNYVDHEGRLRSDFKLGYGLSQNFKRVLVAGCGTVEAAIAGQQLPNAEIVGVDSSLPSLVKCQALLDKSEIKNVELIHTDLLIHRTQNKYDCMIASGVLHHIRSVHDTLRNLGNSLQHGAVFYGMVYPNINRQHIITTIKNFEDFPKNVKGVGMVREFFKTLPDDHPSVIWWNLHEQTDEEIADTWLNPFFKHYSMEELHELLIMSKFTDVQMLYVKNKLTFGAVYQS